MYEIGVVVATYNGEKYIEEQLKSILAQTVKPDFIVVSDANSSDNTLPICEKILSSSGIAYTLLRHDKQLGVVENFEDGAKNCDSRYTFFCDQDDSWLPEKIEKFIAVFKKYDPAMVFSNAYVTNAELEKSNALLWNEVGYKQKQAEKVYEKEDGAFCAELLRRNVVTGMCMAIDNTKLHVVYPFSKFGIHDMWLSHAGILCGRVVGIKQPLVLYRQHANNAVGVESGLRKSYNHRIGYLERLGNRRALIEDVVERFTDEDSITRNIYRDYLKHITQRITYVNKTRFVLSNLKSIPLYIKYEYKWFSIFIKDIYARFFIK